MSRFQKTNSNGNGGGTATAEKKKPVHTIRRYVGGASIEVAIFEKEIEIKGKGTLLTHFMSVTKSYKDDKDEWHNVSVFNPHELVVVAHAVTEAYEWSNAQQDRE